MRDLIIEEETRCDESVQSRLLPSEKESLVLIGVIASRERAAELHFRKSETIAKAISGASETLQLFTTPGIKQVHLAGAARERGKFDAHKPQFRDAIPCV
jgi:hypothetical protein